MCFEYPDWKRGIFPFWMISQGLYEVGLMENNGVETFYKDYHTKISRWRLLYKVIHRGKLVNKIGWRSYMEKITTFIFREIKAQKMIIY
jgi:hypothetical protein